jgi:hypothetical protein
MSPDTGSSPSPEYQLGRSAQARCRGAGRQAKSDSAQDETPPTAVRPMRSIKLVLGSPVEFVAADDQSLRYGTAPAAVVVQGGRAGAS